MNYLSPLTVQQWAHGLQDKPQTLPLGFRDSTLGRERIAFHYRKVRWETAKGLCCWPVGGFLVWAMLSADPKSLSSTVIKGRLLQGASVLTFGFVSWAIYEGCRQLLNIRKQVDWNLYNHPTFSSESQLLKCTIEAFNNRQSNCPRKVGEVDFTPLHWSNEQIYFENYLSPWLAQSLNGSGIQPVWGAFESILGAMQNRGDLKEDLTTQAVMDYVGFLSTWAKAVRESPIGFVRLTPKRGCLDSVHLPGQRPKGLPNWGPASGRAGGSPIFDADQLAAQKKYYDDVLRPAMAKHRGISLDNVEQWGHFQAARKALVRPLLQLHTDKSRQNKDNDAVQEVIVIRKYLECIDHVVKEFKGSPMQLDPSEVGKLTASALPGAPPTIYSR